MRYERDGTPIWEKSKWIDLWLAVIAVVMLVWSVIYWSNDSNKGVAKPAVKNHLQDTVQMRSTTTVYTCKTLPIALGDERLLLECVKEKQ